MSKKSKKWLERERMLWQNGRFVDLWTVVHISMGVLYTSAFLSVGVDPQFVFGAGVAFAILWEFWERVRNVQETIANGLIDIVVFVCASYFILEFGPKNELALYLLAVIFGVVALALRYLGLESREWRNRGGIA